MSCCLLFSAMMHFFKEEIFISNFANLFPEAVDWGCDHGRNWIKIFVFIGSFSTAKAREPFHTFSCPTGQRWFLPQRKALGIREPNHIYDEKGICEKHGINDDDDFIVSLLNVEEGKVVRVKRGIKTSASVHNTDHHPPHHHGHPPHDHDHVDDDVWHFIV